jgi:hypothetical protein
VKGLFQATKQAFVYALDRETGEPIWPIEERPVPQSTGAGREARRDAAVPDEARAVRSAGPDGGAPDRLHAGDPAAGAPDRARQQPVRAALQPADHVDDPAGPAWVCPGGAGGANITGAEVADPVLGIMFITSQSNCGRVAVMPARESPLDSPEQTGVTYSDWSNAGGGGGRGGPTVDGLDIWKGPVGRIVAIDMNTGEHLWTIPNGDAPQAEQDAIRNHPLLQGVPNIDQIANRGRSGHSAMVVSPNLLFASGQTADNEPHLFAIDKMTGRRVGQIPIPGISRYGMSSWEHDGHQYIIVQLQDGLAAFGLPAAMPRRGTPTSGLATRAARR